MNKDWLSQLAPAHPPPPPGWWPPAPGWWLIALLILALAAFLIHRTLRPASRLRRIALRELKRIEAEQQDDAGLAAALTNLLRRYALASHGRETVAQLSGERWLDYVADHVGGELAGETGRNLLRLAYGGQGQAERERWLAGTRNFLRSRQ